jgi:hypothetical protein
MHAVKLRVRAVLRSVAVEFEREVLMSARPFVGLAVGLGRHGEEVPLFLAESSWSAVFQAYVCRAEDDRAEGDYGDDAEALVADYTLAGWQEVTRVSLALCPPKKRKAS